MFKAKFRIKFKSKTVEKLHLLSQNLDDISESQKQETKRIKIITSGDDIFGAGISF